jgi:hypothetical protein
MVRVRVAEHIVSRHLGDDIEAVDADDDQTDTNGPCEIDRLVESNDADRCDGDDPECSPRSVDDTRREVLQRKRG